MTREELITFVENTFVNYGILFLKMVLIKVPIFQISYRGGV